MCGTDWGHCLQRSGRGTERSYQPITVAGLELSWRGGWGGESSNIRSKSATLGDVGDAESRTGS
jgi:hypothetical protein